MSRIPSVYSVMWTPTLRTSRARIIPQIPSHRTVPFRRSYNGPGQAPHTTYFQQPPPQQPSRGRRIISNILWSTGCFAVGGLTVIWALADELSVENLSEIANNSDIPLQEAIIAGTQDILARRVEPINSIEMATDLLKSHSGYSVTPTAVSHTGQLPSNLPCEDTWCSGQYVHFNDSSKDWCQWALFDGHAGARTSEFLKDAVPGVVGGDLVRAKCMDKPYVPNDMHIFRTIQKAFRFVDDELINHGSRSIESDSAALCDVVATAASAYAGSCALMAIFDPAKSILRVANVGDSRAVLGRWNGSNYVAEPMSTDHTGFNQDEVARLQSEHPGEDVVDPRTGRIHGLAVSRAFGDGRWKWVESITKKAHEKFFGPAPRPNGVIKTPPYLTAEPEIKETRVNEGDHPDFLIMASDGLWDLMSSEDAVTCVQMWLGKNNPIQFLQQKESAQAPSWGTFWKSSEPPVAPPTYYSTLDLLGENDEVYYDENEKCLRWKVSPKHFVVEDDNCGVHLIKNALGGKRRDLFTGVLTVQPPYSRNVRDDITVHVIFFGIDPSKTTKHLRS